MIPDDYPQDRIGRCEAQPGPLRQMLRQGKEMASDSAPAVRFDCSAAELVEIDDLASDLMIPIAQHYPTSPLGRLRLLRLLAYTRSGS